MLPKGHARVWWTVVTVVVAATAGPAYPALAPQEVLVVGNANSADSVELAKFYADARGIPQQNVLLVKAVTTYEISHAEYDAQVRDPIREHLRKNKLEGRIRAICLMWGIPIRVTDDVTTRYTVAASQAFVRMAVDRRLLVSVGKDFTVPKIADLKPVSALFAPTVSITDTSAMKADDLHKDVDRLLAEKLTEVGKIVDPAKRQIASRQLMGVYQDIHGLRGLVRFLGDSKLPGGPKVEDLKAQIDSFEKTLAEQPKVPTAVQGAKARLDLIDEISGAWGLWTAPEETRQFKPADAALDSELALLWFDEYPLPGPMPNPLFWRNPPDIRSKKVPPTMLVSRIDGPTKADAMRIIKGSIEAEKAGLKGICYIDAGGLERAKQYDDNFRMLYRLILTNTKSKAAVLDEKKEVFPPRSCPNAALYVGWYSLQKYVPAFIWQTGAVGWHVTSFEAMHLRDADSQEWCAKMIQNGVVATIGGVNEPYLGAFPLPQDFFPLLMTGKYTVAECYYRTTPYLSWRLTFIADPLYNPFAVDGEVGVEQLPKGLAP
jgi:uncharacterized protein (TIGR03790 family)